MSKGQKPLLKQSRAVEGHLWKGPGAQCAKANDSWYAIFQEICSERRIDAFVSQCDGGRPCNGCTERPTFCTYQDNTRDNIRARALEAEQMQPTEVEARPEPDGLPTETTPAPTPAPQKRKPKRAPAVAAAEERDVQKELGDAMNEFDRLRAQLAAAAERIQQLEQEKARVAAASQPAWNVILPADYANMRKTKENVSHGAQTP